MRAGSSQKDLPSSRSHAWNLISPLLHLITGHLDRECSSEIESAFHTTTDSWWLQFVFICCHVSTVIGKSLLHAFLSPPPSLHHFWFSPQVVIASNCKSRPLLTEAFLSKLLEDNTTGEWFNIHIPRTVAPKPWNVQTPFKGESTTALKERKHSVSLWFVRYEYHCVLPGMQRCFMMWAAALGCWASSESVPNIHRISYNIIWIRL